MIENYDAYGIASDLIADLGTQPEYLSIIETVGEYAKEEGLDTFEEAKLLTEVEGLIKGVTVYVSFPDGEKFKL